VREAREVYAHETHRTEDIMTTSLAESPSNIVLPSLSKGAIWTGRILSGFAVLFMTFDAGMKIIQPPMAVQGTTDLGYPASVIFPLGLIQLVCLALYLIPRTAVLGAILWVGYLGGAVATHVRVGNPLFSHVLFPLYVAAFLWIGLGLRDERVRALFQPRKPA
jgi:DoxX-like protein